MTHDTMAKLIPGFASPTYKVVQATFGFTGDSLVERTDRCRSSQYDVETNGFLMQFIIMVAKEGEIRVNGRKLAEAGRYKSG